ncbi:MAG: methyl-accepting chemotaxis protein [Stappiaceae bacterium]
MNRFLSLAGIKISTRINILVGVAMASTVVLGGIYLYSDRLLGEQIDRQLDYVHLGQLTTAIDTSALQLRRNEKDFLLRRDTKYLDRYLQNAEKVQNSLEAISALDHADKVTENLANLAVNFQRHKDHFVKVVEQHKQIGLNEKEGLQGELRASVHAAEENLAKANLDSLTVKMLMMRRHEKDFMLRGAEKYIGRIDQRREEFDALLSQSSLPASMKNELSALMDNYQAGFKRYADIALVLAADTKLLSKIYADTGPDLQALLETSQKGEAEAEAALIAGKANMNRLLMILIPAILIVVTGLGIYIGRSIIGPLRSLTFAMEGLAEGDTSIILPSADDRNEIGDMARAVDLFKANEVRKLEIEAENDKNRREADGEEKRMAMQDLADQFDASVGVIVDELSVSTVDLNKTAQSMTVIVDKTNAEANAVAAASEEATSNVQTVAAATEEMSNSISEINGQVAEASQASGKAADDITKTTEQMARLSETADKIGEVISLIAGIAEQTNLLALNATIESARAGEAGKGFAVVASEVKALASETGKATESISELITEVQSETATAVSAIDDIGTVVNQLNETLGVIAGAMEEQGATTHEVSRNVTDVAAGNQEVSQSISGVNDASRQTGEISKQVTLATDNLSQQTDSLKTQVTHFLESIRAA